MEFASYITFIMIVTSIVVSPGPNLFLLLNSVPVNGRISGMMNIIGFCLAILTHVLLSLLGLGAIQIATSPTLFTVVKLIGAFYLIWLGIKALKSAWNSSSSRQQNTNDIPKTSAIQSIADGWITNAFNPKPALFYIAAFLQFISIDATSTSFFLQGIALGFTHVAIAAIWYGLIVLGIDRANLWLRKPQVWRVVQSITGTALIAFGIKLATVRSLSQ